MSQMAMPLMIFSAATQAFGAIQSGNAEKAAYNRKADEQERVATDIEVSGEQQKREMVYQQGLTKGTQTEGYAAGGVAAGGSALELLQETTRRDSLNLANLDYNVKSQAYAQRAGAVSSRFAGKQAQYASRIQATTALTAGLGRAATGSIGTPTQPDPLQFRQM